MLVSLSPLPSITPSMLVTWHHPGSAPLLGFFETISYRGLSWIGSLLQPVVGISRNPSECDSWLYQPVHAPADRTQTRNQINGMDGWMDGLLDGYADGSMEMERRINVRMDGNIILFVDISVPRWSTVRMPVPTYSLLTDSRAIALILILVLVLVVFEHG